MQTASMPRGATETIDLEAKADVLERIVKLYDERRRKAAPSVLAPAPADDLDDESPAAPSAAGDKPDPRAVLAQLARLANRGLIRKGVTPDPNDPAATVAALKAELKRRYARQLDAFVQHPRFQALHGRWLALRQLVTEPDAPPDMEVRVIHANKKAVLDDLRKAGGDVKRTRLYKLQVRDHFGRVGGKPSLFTVSDLTIGPDPDSLAVATLLARIGQIGHKPVIANAAPQMFGVENWEDLSTDPETLKKYLGSVALASYRTLRGEDYARWLVLTLAGVHIRSPYGDGNAAPGAEGYAETVRSARGLTAAGAAPLVGARIAAAVGRFGWPARILGELYGGRISGLAVVKLTTATGDDETTCPTQVVIDEDLEGVVEQLGFLPLVHVQDSNDAVIYAAPAVVKLLTTTDKKANADASLAAKLPCVLIQAMLAQMLKVVFRSLIGSNKTAAQVEQLLQDYLNEYVLEKPEGASEEARAERPFTKLVAHVEEDPENPGHLRATIVMVPHHQIASFEATLVVRAEDEE